jgi:hypothetical protein
MNLIKLTKLNIGEKEKQEVENALYEMDNTIVTLGIALGNNGIDIAFEKIQNKCNFVFKYLNHIADIPNIEEPKKVVYVPSADPQVPRELIGIFEEYKASFIFQNGSIWYSIETNIEYSTVR